MNETMDSNMLQRIIEKSQRNGYDFMNRKVKKYEIECIYPTGIINITITNLDGYRILCNIHINQIVFNQDFLKAYFGEGWELVDEINGLEMLKWQYHAQQLVLSDNIIDYLYKYLED